MTPAQQYQLYSLIGVAIVVPLVLMRRMRPQPVRPNRLLVRAVVIVALLCFALFSDRRLFLSSGPTLLLAPVALAAGCGLGYLLVRTMAFWTDAQTGELWAKGGVLFLVIVVVTLVLRIGIQTLAGPSGRPGSSGGFLADLSADLILLAMGMWTMRALLLYLRYRQHAAAHDAVTA